MADKDVIEKNFLGRTGMLVSNLCFGTSTFGSQPHEIGRPAADDETAMKLLDRFVEAGGNWIDTADMYSYGESEKLVGKWLQGKQRDRLIVTSKVGTWIDKSNVNDTGLSRKHLVESLERTLENLQTPYLDIYLMHRWDYMIPTEDVIRTFNDFVRCGKIRYFGGSNFSGWQLQKMMAYAKFMGADGASVLQSEYNLLTREIEYEVSKVCKEECVPLTPWGALKGGLLSGKIKRGMTKAPEGSRIGWASARGGKTVTAPTWESFCEREQVWDTIDKLTEVAEKKEKSLSQVALRWLLQQEVVPSVVFGARNMEQLESVIGASSGWSLSPEEMEELSAVSEPFMTDTYLVGRKSENQRRTARKPLV